MNCSKGRSASTKSLEIKKRLNFCLLKNCGTKMTNLVSYLFILLSVHPVWGEDGVGLPYQYDGNALRKTGI